MKYEEINNKVILTDLEDFNIEEILECGQFFRYEKIDKLYYKIVAMNKVLNIKQVGNSAELYPCTLEEFESIWYDFFDFRTDYGKIKKEISNDEIMLKATKYASGIRLLNQDKFECLLSFIISQNNNIPRIKGIIERLSETYGTKLGDKYLFPTLRELENADIDSLYELRMGFRAKYIYDAIEKIKTKEVNLDITDNLDTESLLNMLLKIKGVGQKVADCAMLFSMKRREVFPTDVWVKRVMEELYFNKEETNIKIIHDFAKNKWGNLSGFAQQYLFYYARSLKIGTEKKGKK
ncbi:MAG: DNA-3-methyladenine glycosylase family protein [Lachnospirales bacterium]